MNLGDGIIHLASKRERKDMETYRSFRTIDPSNSLGRLIGFRDDTLTPKAHAHYLSNHGRLLLPLIGDIVAHERIGPGQAKTTTGEILISNPYESQLVNYLDIKFATRLQSQVIHFDLEKSKNSLISLSSGIYIGKYDGRREDVLKFDSPSNVFTFIIEGAFEVQNRLLESRDGLSLKKIHELEFEALSNEAMMLIINAEE
jgi:hypothetical protein